MEEKVSKRGGKRENAGRKPKAEERKIIEKLSPLEDTVLKKFKSSINCGEKWAIELYFKYMYGLPKQITEVDLKGDINIPPINWVSKD